MRRRRLAGRPRAPSRAPETFSRGAQRTRQGRGRLAVLRLRKTLRRAPSFAMLLHLQQSAGAAKWGHGVGRHARQNAGEKVSTCKNLRVRSKPATVQTGLYPRSYRKSRRLSYSIGIHTSSVENILNILDDRQWLVWHCRAMRRSNASCVKAPTLSSQSPRGLVSKPPPRCTAQRR